MLVAAAIIKKDERILIAQRPKGDKLEYKWELPGGKLEEGETLEECLKRELSEEFGIDTMIGAFFASSDFQYENEPGRLFVFHVSVVDGKFKPTSHEQIRWVHLSELSTYDFAKADRDIIRRIHTNSQLSM